MNKDNSKQRASAQVEEVGVPAKDSRISELNEGAEEGKRNRSVRMSKPELVEVVDMCDAKVYGRNEYNMPRRYFSEEMQSDDDRSEHDFLSDRPGNVVPPTHPATEGFGDSAAANPFFPFTFGDSSFKEGTQE